MKRTLLSVFIVFVFAFTASAQYSGDCQGCGNGNDNYNDDSSPKTSIALTTKAKKKKISVYPNPAANFIGLSDSKDVKKITILNVMGREARSFEVEKGMKYNVADLRKGMYLVQIIGYDNKVITTQRLNKR